MFDLAHYLRHMEENQEAYRRIPAWHENYLSAPDFLVLPGGRDPLWDRTPFEFRRHWFDSDLKPVGSYATPGIPRPVEPEEPLMGYQHDYSPTTPEVTEAIETLHENNAASQELLEMADAVGESFIEESSEEYAGVWGDIGSPDPSYDPLELGDYGEGFDSYGGAGLEERLDEYYMAGPHLGLEGNLAPEPMIELGPDHAFDDHV